MTVTDATGLTARLAQFVEQTSYAALPAATIANAKLAILDTVACALAAARFPVGTLVLEQVRAQGCRGPATVWAGGLQVPAPQAAWANGHLANALDFDLSLHLDTHLLPPAFALGEQLRVDGQRFLAAYIVAREVGARLMQALDGGRWAGQGVTQRGWWHVGLVSPLDAALVAARLLQLEAEGIARALGIAACAVGGFRRNMGMMAKALHAAQGARAGLEAALLAQRGFTGDPEILEAPLGLIATLCPAGDFDAAALTDGLGTRYSLETPPKCKPFPACGPAQAQIDSLLALRQQHAIAPDQIVRVVANFHPHSLFRPAARDQVEAAFSTPYIIAATLLDGEFTLRQLAEARVFAPEVRALMARVQDDPAAPDRRVTVELRDGRRLVGEAEQRRTLGSWDELSAKFFTCAEGQLAPTAAEAFRATLAELEHLDDLARLLELLRRGAIPGRLSAAAGTV